MNFLEIKKSIGKLAKLNCHIVPTRFVKITIPRIIENQYCIVLDIMKRSQANSCNEYDVYETFPELGELHYSYILKCYMFDKIVLIEVWSNQIHLID